MQEEHINARPRNLKLKDGLYVKKSGAPWIPYDDGQLQLRICLIAHTSTGHRDTNATEFVIFPVFSGKHFATMLVLSYATAFTVSLNYWW